MISRDTIFRPRTLIIGLLALGAGTLVWLQSGMPGAQNRSGQATAGTTQTNSVTHSSILAPLTLTKNSNATPPDVPEQEWQQMVAAMRATPGGESDLPRIGEYLTFQHRVALWQKMRQDGDYPAERLPLAHYLLDALPLHVSRTEVTGFEAKTLQAQLLEDLVPDAGQRQQAMNTGTKNLVDAEPKADPEVAQAQQARMSDYKKREAEITAQWQAMSPAARDPHWLETQLDAARRATLDEGKVN
ncbi:MAG: hypothetical protein PSX71_12275 [bacterium]|nr:hypothetical protein [bacterium]